MKYLENIKENNKKKILRLLYSDNVMSKKRIALQLKLSPSVITKLCSELIKEGKVVESNSIKKSSVGRNEVQIQVCPSYKYCIGISITHIKGEIILSDLSMNLIHKSTIPMNTNPNIFLDSLIISLNELISDYKLVLHDILGIGVSIKGITDGISSYSGIWTSVVNIKDYIEEKTGISTVVDNGIRCSAILEQFYSNYNNFVFIKYMSPGIGGAIVKHGKILHGENNCIVDFGHMIVDPLADYCPICKRKGCLESIISFDRIIQFSYDNFKYEFSPILYNKCNGDKNNITIDRIIETVDEGCINYNKLFKKISSYFAICLINTFAVIDTNKFIIVGDLFSSNRFNEYFKSAIYEYQLTPIIDKLEIRTDIDIKLSPIALCIHSFLLS